MHFFDGPSESLDEPCEVRRPNSPAPPVVASPDNMSPQVDFRAMLEAYVVANDTSKYMDPLLLPDTKASKDLAE
jgi:hypothetical protein